MIGTDRTALDSSREKLLLVRYITLLDACNGGYGIFLMPLVMFYLLQSHLLFTRAFYV